MDLLFCLDRILTDFRDLFNTQNVVLFRAFIIGFIVNNSKGTVTQIYQAGPRSKRYWSLVKFLSRGKWDADAVAIRLIKRIQTHFPNWVYVYDDTKAIKTGKTQWGLHFFRNFRYQKRNVNQSKFHLGHQFGALGVLCATATHTLLLPVWVKLINPKTIRDKSDAVLKRICSKIPKGLIIFDRGFSRRKVFATVMRYGHQILCRAKSNAVFYYLPKVSKRGRGRPKKYGACVDIRRLQYKEMEIAGKRHSIASKVVRTKMCDAVIRLVVIRTRSKKCQPYRYFCVFTTDLTREIPQIVDYYRQRWQMETAFRDAKQHFGFDSYQVKSRKSINRFVQLSFVAASITKLIFSSTESGVENGVSIETVCNRLGIHWYHPEILTQGLRVAYLRLQLMTHLFSASLKASPNSQKITPVFEQDTPLPLDKAA